MRVKRLRVVAICCASLLACSARADIFLNEGTNISVDVAPDGRLITDLLGGLWLIPSNGGEAQALATGQRSAQRPRWSADGTRLIFATNTAERSSLWLYDVEQQEGRAISTDYHADYDPDWHPDGTRIVFSSARDEQGLDLWEADINTGSSWRMTSLPGDETEPAWSANGENLAYVHRQANEWRLVLKRRGQPAETLARSTDRIAAPSWRPDGSLLTWLQETSDGWVVQMTILAQPRLTRTLISGEDFFIAPVAWRNRQEMIYAAGGKLRRRDFNSWTSRNIPFHANVGSASGFASPRATVRRLPEIPQPAGRRILRATRLFDGLGSAVRENQDIVIDGGVIAAVEPRRTRTDGIVIDLGEATVMAGYIDSYARLDAATHPSMGPLLLGLGVTTLISDHPRAAELNATWSGKPLPGPRVLPAAAIDSASHEKPYPWLITLHGDMTTGTRFRDAVHGWQKRGVAVLADSWQAALGSGAALLLGTDTRPASPRGVHYQDVQLASGVGAITFVSGLADASTGGLDDILQNRVARAIGAQARIKRRFARPPHLTAAAPLLVLGSAPNGLPPGIALHAEFRALADAGLRNEQVLRTAGVNAAAALGFGLQLGRVTRGAAADLLVIDGNPLTTIDDTLKIIGVVRNGRFYSVSGLLDLAEAARNVE